MILMPMMHSQLCCEEAELVKAKSRLETINGNSRLQLPSKLEELDESSFFQFQAFNQLLRQIL